MSKDRCLLCRETDELWVEGLHGESKTGLGHQPAHHGEQRGALVEHWAPTAPGPKASSQEQALPPVAPPPRQTDTQTRAEETQQAEEEGSGFQPGQQEKSEEGASEQSSEEGRGENCPGSQTEGTVSARRSWEFDHLRPDGHRKSPDFSRSVAGSELGLRRTTLALGQGQEPKGWAGGQAATRGSHYNIIATTYG